VVSLSRPTESLSSEALDDRLIATARLLLALAALLIIWIDPSEPDQNVAATYFTLALYVSYSALLYYLVRWQPRFVARLHSWFHWADVGWYAVLISLSTGTNSLFFFGFYFAILVSAFRQGLMAGVGTAIAAAVSFTMVGLLVKAESGSFELNRFLLRLISLLVVGYLIAYWGDAEIRHRQRLTFIRTLTRLFNPRWGSDYLIGSLLEQLWGFYKADTCLLVMFDAPSATYSLRRATTHDPQMALHTEPLSAAVAAQLFNLSSQEAVLFRAKSRGWLSSPKTYAWEPDQGPVKLADETSYETIATLLDTDFYLTVPFTYHPEMPARLWLTRHQVFTPSEAEFLLQVIAQMMPVIQHIRLLDQLATAAAEEERQRIARDIHDSVIQPYIGLQLGLQALQQKIAAGHPQLSAAVENLLALTELGITDLRHYVATLRETNQYERGLLPALHRFTAKFTELTGIQVQVQAGQEIQLAPRLVGEVIQMVAEGLSNIRRHTHSKRALIHLACQSHHFILTISNDQPDGLSPSAFQPRSLTGRAEALGGEVSIEHNSEAALTNVIIKIPL
jgi:signal transduction histidine kinase